MVFVSVFHLHDITCRWWEPGIGEPGSPGPQNHPLLAPLVWFASLPPFSRPFVPSSPPPSWCVSVLEFSVS